MLGLTAATQMFSTELDCKQTQSLWNGKHSARSEKKKQEKKRLISYGSFQIYVIFWQKLTNLKLPATSIPISTLQLALKTDFFSPTYKRKWLLNNWFIRVITYLTPASRRCQKWRIYFLSNSSSFYLFFFQFKKR